jgi:hypothetical protein
MEADAARWKLLFYQHPLEVDDPKLQTPKAVLIAWMGMLSDQILRSSFWVEAFGRVAITMAECAERAAGIAATQAFATWLQEGSASGLKRQHLLTRTATGWIPAKVDAEEVNSNEDPDELDGLSAAELAAVKGVPDGVPTPLGAQQTANAERTVWGSEWGAGEDYLEPTWTVEDSLFPPPLLLAEFRAALATFPCGTGLGWDDLHPRALLRLADRDLLVLINLIARCEREGRWPDAVQLVVVVLLPKLDGGFRTIGLLPLLPRVWMRARRSIAKMWEKENSRPYPYAGEARGATVAAWKQAARAELAATLGTDYGQVLLDLVKAFERIPHHVLVREARRLGYPAWLIRLSLATYRLHECSESGQPCLNRYRQRGASPLAQAWLRPRCG